MQTTGSVTRLLDAWRNGEPDAADRLFTVVYDDLRLLARRQLARLRPGQTLAPTALVHETYLKFSKRAAPEAVDRLHFLNLAARAMRHIVIDHLRRKRSRKRDGGIQVPLETGAVAVDGSPVDLLAMSDALTALERLDPRQARVVELRFFGGLELKEIATMLDASERTIKRDWQKARAFLEVALG
jgi:RNA polymerase sigma factor (TIGR02999 family)